MKRRRYLSVLGAAALSGCARFGTDETTRTPTNRTTSPGETTDSTSPKPTDRSTDTTDATSADDPPENETTAADSAFRTIPVEANQYRQISVESGETLENVFIDISAKGASAQIVPSGADWTVGLKHHREVEARRNQTFQTYPRGVEARTMKGVESRFPDHRKLGLYW